LSKIHSYRLLFGRWDFAHLEFTKT